MLKAKSLSTFRTKLDHSSEMTKLVNPGDIIEGDEEHLRALARNRLVEILDDDTDKAAHADEPAPAVQSYTRESLKAMSKPRLVDLAKSAFGLDLSIRSTEDSIVEAIINAQSGTMEDDDQ